MSFCIESAVEAVGGEDELEPGDIILMNDPYKTGSHPQDAAVVMPVYLDDGTLIGYTAIKAHWMDIGAKEIYCTDTVDVFQEGMIFPGVKLYRRGELVTRHLAHGARQLAPGDVRRGRHQRAGRGVRTGARRASCGWSSATGSSASPSRSSACTTTARRSCAATSRRSPTAATSAAA